MEFLEILEEKNNQILLAWRTFLDQLPVEKAKKMYIINENRTCRFEHGTDLPNAVIELFM